MPAIYRLNAVHEALFGGPRFWMFLSQVQFIRTDPSLLFPPCSLCGLIMVLMCINVFFLCGFLTGSGGLQIMRKVLGQFIFPDTEQSKSALLYWCLK